MDERSKWGPEAGTKIGRVLLAISVCTAVACSGTADDAGNERTPSAAGQGGSSPSGGPQAGAPTARAGQDGGGQSSTAGQSNSGGQTPAGGQSATGGQTATGGRSGTAGQAGGGQTSTGGQASSAGQGSGGGGNCPHVQLKGSDICTIGDSWIQLQGNQVTTLEDHLVQAGVMPQGDHFDRREVSGSTLSSIIGTYNNKPSNCRILIMDGGGIDLFSTPAGDQAAIAPVVKKFEDFLAKVKSDGYVQHIIYSLYPVIPSTRNLNTNMKPGFSAACAASAVDCHLVDLEPLFMGKHFASDNTHADVAGGVIIGDAWWKVMQANCIAQ